MAGNGTLMIFSTVTTYVNVSITPSDVSDFNASTKSYTIENYSLLGTNNSLQECIELVPKRDPLLIVVPLTIFYAIILVTGILGNVITCLVIAKNKHMGTATNYYLFSLAVSDLLLLITGLPQEMYYVWSRYPYVFGETFCLLRGLAAETSTNATVLTITAFTVERYIAICHPFLAHTMSNRSRCVKLIISIWIIALTFAIPQALQFGLVNNGPETTQCTMKVVIVPHSFELSTLFFFVIPMSIITVLYTLIALKLRRSSKLSKPNVAMPVASLRNDTSATGYISNTRRIRRPFRPSSQRVLRMLVAVVVAFFICWAPFHIQRLVAIYGMHGPDNPGSPLMMKLYGVVTYISGILYYVSTTINPILYHTMSYKFRSAFKDTLSHICCKVQKKGKSYFILRRQSGQHLHDVRIRIKLMPMESSTTDSGTGTSIKIPYVQYLAESSENFPGNNFDSSSDIVVQKDDALQNPCDDSNHPVQWDIKQHSDCTCAKGESVLTAMKCFSCFQSATTPDGHTRSIYLKRRNLIAMHVEDKSSSSMDSNAISNSSLKAIDSEAIKDELVMFNNSNHTDNSHR